VRHLYEISLSEKELQVIISSVRLVGTDRYHQQLAARLESELWLPYHQNVTAGKRKEVRRS
jgi:hypothetical protein